MQSQYKIRLRRGDTVVVRSGKYKGQTGKITSVLPKLNAVIVEGVNVVKKHQKPNSQHPQGGIIEITKPINVSKLGIYNPTTKKAERIAYNIDKSGNKVRVFAKSRKEIN